MRGRVGNERQEGSERHEGRRGADETQEGRRRGSCSHEGRGLACRRGGDAGRCVGRSTRCWNAAGTQQLGALASLTVLGRLATSLHTQRPYCLQAHPLSPTQPHTPNPWRTR
eukprot:360101-Chlamydomonas_euryale.AAC.3